MKEGYYLKRASKFVALIFTVIAVAVTFSFYCSAANKTVKSDGFIFSVGKTATLVEYKGKAEKVVIPQKINGVKVTKIEQYAFWQNKKIKSVSIPQTVTTIGVAAFDECTALTKVVLPKSLTKLSDSAFWYCTNLKTVVMYENLKTIGQNAFKGCQKNMVFYCAKGSQGEKYAKKISGAVIRPVYISSIGTDVSALNLEVGSTKGLKITVAPSNAYNRKYSITASDKSVIAVSSKGSVKALKPGTATVTLKAGDGSGKTKKVTVTVVPSKVKTLKQSSSSATTCTLTWSKSSGAQKYRVYVYKDKKWVKLADTTKTSYKVSGLKAGSSAKYTVRSYSTVNKKNYCSSCSPTVTASTKVAQNVTSLSFTSGDSWITLKWNKTKNTDAYRVYRYNTKTKKYEVIATTENTSYKVSSLTANSSYRFAVRSCYVESGKYILAKSYAAVNAYTLPQKVKSVKAEQTQTSGNELVITWKAVSGITGYRIYYKPVGASSWQGVTVGAKTTKHTLSSLVTNTKYEIKIRAYTKRGDKIYWGSYSDTVTASAIFGIGNVKAVKQTAYTDTSVTISYSAVDSAATYSIYQMNTDGSYSFVGGTRKTEFTVSGLDSDTEYTFAVKANRVVGNLTAESNDFSPAVKCATSMPTPKNVKAAAIKNEPFKLSLSWTGGEDDICLITYGKSGGTEKKVKTVVGNKAVIDGLERRTPYNVTVEVLSKHFGKQFNSPKSEEITAEAYKKPTELSQALNDLTAAFENTENSAKAVSVISRVNADSVKTDLTNSEVVSVLENAACNCIKSKAFNGSKDVRDFLGTDEAIKIRDDVPNDASFKEDGSGFSVSFTAENGKFGTLFNPMPEINEAELDGYSIISRDCSVRAESIKVGANDSISNLKLISSYTFVLSMGSAEFSLSFETTTYISVL